MVMPRRVDRVEMAQLLRSGKSRTEIAKIMGVTKSAISRAARELNLGVVKSVALEDAHRVVSDSLDTLQQLSNINSKANQLLEAAMRVIRGEEKFQDNTQRDPREMALKAMQEIRGQLKLQLEIFQTLYDMKAVQEFQSEVLTTIGEESPDTRDRIIRRLKESKALRNSVQITM